MRYETPEMTFIDFSPNGGIVMGSGNNGNHYGWDNPNNPHYNMEEEL